VVVVVVGDVFCFEPMECTIGWLVNGNESEKRDFDSYMIPEDGVADEVGTGLPMMYPCDLISRSWVPHVGAGAAEIQQGWLAWRPPCSSFWLGVTGAAVTPLGPLPHTNPIRPGWRSRISPRRRQVALPGFSHCVCRLSLERSLQRLLEKSDQRRPLRSYMQSAQG